jgi:FkbM family methyltransferase
MKLQILTRVARPVLRSLPIGVTENLSKLVPRKKMPGLLRPALENRDVVLRHGLGRGLHFNAGKYNYRAALGHYEMPVQRAIAENLQAGDVCYDIGANVGFFSVLAASRVGSGGRLFAFEPEPGNATMLRHNVEMNGFAHVTIFENAVSSQPGRAVLMLVPYSGSHSLAEFRTPKDVVNQITVDTVQVDQLVENRTLTPPTLVKIDVEGAEYPVMQGMARTIETYRPKIVYEVDAEREDEAKVQEKKIERFLGARGYEMHRLENSYVGISHYVAHFLAKPAEP